ncbi:thiol reductant ABC exporter subunit CydD [Chrysiogenes arsenatis]|uniref:thiol reductant ABC exporter subunit CydD n=1 Tax=Chrysiogenes arsenatis TaxID=309797 RepID=UPI0004113B53|nr:thiol reductant ABC exporter subunit CydD [Chrysiogenes arsenatis]
MTTPTPQIWLKKISSPARFWIFGAIACGATSAILVIFQAWLFASIIAQGFIDRVPLPALLPSLALVAGAIVLRALANAGRELAGQRAGEVVRTHVRNDILAQLARLGPAYIALTPAGTLATITLERTEALHNFVAHYVPQKYIAMIVPVLIASAIFPVSWAAGSILLITAPLIPFFMTLVGRNAASLHEKHFVTLGRMSVRFLDTLRGLTTLKLLGRSKAESQRIAAASEEYRKGTMSVLRVAFLSSAILEFFTAVAIAMSAVYLGLHYLGYVDFGLYGRELTLQTGLFILLLAPEFYQPLRELGTHYHARAEALGAADGIVALLHTPAEAPTEGHLTVPHPNDGITLVCDNVSYTYAGREQPALVNFSETFRSGEWVAITGESGAGKTTLLQLLLGFIPVQHGEISINGTPLHHLSLASWRDNVVWVSQNPALFYGTIYENILLAKADATAAEVHRAASKARVIDFCQHFDKGIHTEVGEQGRLLSGGEGRRVALARAFLKDAPVLLLDEPTAGLDHENEAIILEALQELARGKTTIMVTHREQAAHYAGRVITLPSFES